MPAPTLAVRMSAVMNGPISRQSPSPMIEAMRSVAPKRSQLDAGLQREDHPGEERDDQHDRQRPDAAGVELVEQEAAPLPGVA